MNVEHFEADLLALSKKYNLAQAVIIFRDDADIRIRAIGNGGADNAGAMAIAAVVDRAIKANREFIVGAMELT